MTQSLEQLAATKEAMADLTAGTLPAIPEQAPFAVVSLGGLGADQLRVALHPALVAAGLPLWRGAAVDGYRSDWVTEIRRIQPRRLAVVSHSLGHAAAYDGLQALMAEELIAAALWISIEGVDYHGRRARPPVAEIVLLHGAAPLDFPLASVSGVAPIVVPGTDHNSICQQAGVVARCVAMLERARDENGMRLSLGIQDVLAEGFDVGETA